jgi:hypothetical protein
MDQQKTFPRIEHGLAFGIRATCGECGKKVIRVFIPMYTFDPEKDPSCVEEIAGGGLPVQESPQATPHLGND